MYCGVSISIHYVETPGNVRACSYMQERCGRSHYFFTPAMYEYSVLVIFMNWDSLRKKRVTS